MNADEIALLTDIRDSVILLISLFLKMPFQLCIDTSHHMKFITQQVCAGAKCFLDIEQICHLRSIGIKWKEIATMMGVSRMTLYRKHKDTCNRSYKCFITMVYKSSEKALQCSWSNVTLAHR